MTAISRVSRSFTNIVGDLTRDLPQSLSPNAFGLLACSPEANAGEVAAGLQAALPFPVVGGSTWAQPFEPRDEDVSARLTIVQRQGLKFAASVSPPLQKSDSRRQMAELFRDCEARLGERPKLLLAFLPMLPDLAAELYLPFLFEAAEGLPVFGGMTSDDYTPGRSLTLAGGRAYADRMVLVGLGGEVEPVFAARCELNLSTEYLPTVTEVDGCTLRRVDDMTLCDYLAAQGFDTANERLLAGWPLTLEVRGRRPPVEGLADTCDLLKLNLADGSGLVANHIPEGARIGLGIMGKSGILKTTRECLEDILGQVEDGRARGRHYSVLFCLPCIARYFIMVGDDEQAGERVKAAAPEDLALFGYYGFNEVCPAPLPGGRRENLMLGDSVIMCAF
ncbi:MAG: hypothetical protein LBV79_07365 [Candidatus Adiutrix sp.]|jgi:hypothetical protein|nr:hypothetical protein [Candidatus Adiutrix sp.]